MSITFDQVLLYFSGFVLFAYIAILLEFHFGNKSLHALRDLPVWDASRPTPKISVLVPARNEERNIEEALTSVLNLDYPDYEILVLNDRSEDRTGEILERMSRQYPQLRVVHIESLPQGWLGKNHALYEGAKQSTGELLLFTDADIVMDPATLSRAAAYMESRRLDHLAMMPELKMPGFLLNWFSCGFAVFFALYSRPWFVRYNRMPFHIGIGAFNLMRRECYEAIGTHAAIAMRPDDDMKLGRLVKKYGFRQELVKGIGTISVEWYKSLPELVEGLMKNAFAGLEYSVILVILGTASQLILNVWPVVALFFTDGPTWWLNLAIWFCMIVLCTDNARFYDIRPRDSFACGVGFPVVSLLMMFIILKSTFRTLKNNGISWRGTHYPLRALRANRV